jgi:hypothetical protein
MLHLVALVRTDISVERGIIIIITTGTTALCEPWPSSGFLNNLIFTL